MLLVGKAVYNALIGYLFLHRLATGLEDLLLFFVAMALHFVVNDHGLREHHKDAYLRKGRWILAAAVVLGWVVGLLTEIPEVAIAVLTAFLAGGVIMNVLKEELPEERERRFWAFALGAAFHRDPTGSVIAGRGRRVASIYREAASPYSQKPIG